MSEEQRITKVEKEKDPRRVEAEKRLAAISRAAKEKKARQRSESDQQHTEPEPTEEVCNEGYSTMTVLTGVGVLTGLVCLYFTYIQNKRSQTTTEPKQQPTEVSKQQPTPSSSSKLRSLDD